jgi:crossover junction endodeoxyribonuclease RusA
MDGAVGLDVEIRIKRPKKHYRTGKFADVLRDDAPRRPIGDKTGDLSKFVRGVEGALEGIAFTNDARVCMGANVKLYADKHNPEGALIHVWEIVE